MKSWIAIYITAYVFLIMRRPVWKSLCKLQFISTNVSNVNVRPTVIDLMFTSVLRMYVSIIQRRFHCRLDSITACTFLAKAPDIQEPSVLAVLCHVTITGQLASKGTDNLFMERKCQMKRLLITTNFCEWNYSEHDRLWLCLPNWPEYNSPVLRSRNRDTQKILSFRPVKKFKKK